MAYHSSIEHEPVNWKSGYLRSLNKKYSEHFAGLIYDARKNWRKFRNHKRKTLRTHRKGNIKLAAWSE